MYKTVKEVCELTGLKRKDLFDYERQEMVIPSAYSTRGYTDRDGTDYHGYKLYDEDAVLKLQLIAIYKKLGLKRSEIKKRIIVDDYDCIKILDEQLKMLNKEKEEIENKILFAEQLKIIGLKNKFARELAGVDIAILVENIRNWQNSRWYKEMTNVLESTIPANTYSGDMTEVFEQLFLLNEIEYESDRAKELLKKLFQINMREFGIAGFFIILGIVIGAEGDGIVGKEIGEQFEGYPIKKVANLIMNYFPKFIGMVVDLCVEKILQYNDVIGSAYSETRVKELAFKVNEILSTNLGIKKEFEYDLLIEVLKWIEQEIEQKLDVKYEYTLNAIKYHCL